ncbi:MAG: metal-dependent hydrolase [Solirubrobacteraceae bacterium]
MRNATHELVGVSLAIMAGRAFEAGAPETVGLAAAALLGSRLPDVDQRGARVHRRTGLERGSVLVCAVGAVLRLPFVAFAVLASHRAVTHSALACAAAAALAAFVAAPLGTSVALVVSGGVAIGYTAHVAADACTPGGVRLWAPASRRRVWLLPAGARIRTGSWGEAALAAVAVAAPVLVLLA